MCMTLTVTFPKFQLGELSWIHTDVDISHPLPWVLIPMSSRHQKWITETESGLDTGSGNSVAIRTPDSVWSIQRYLSAQSDTTEIWRSTPELGWRRVCDENRCGYPSWPIDSRKQQNWYTQFRLMRMPYIRNLLTTEKWLATNDRIQITYIVDPFICSSLNLIWQKMAGAELPVSIRKVCDFLNERKLNDGCLCKLSF